jgi:AcrR family transcriptional regulator
MTQAEISATPARPVNRERDLLRTDAQHNHERILAVAREALGASADTSLNSIAKMAGVGPGTLYRHFPTREALVLAVYDEDVQALTRSARELLAQHQPLDALRLWFDRLAAYGATKHSLAQALRSAASDGRADTAHRPVAGALATLLSACQQDGRIQPDVEPDDVLLLLGFMWQREPGPISQARVARLLDLIVAGLQAEAPRPTSQPHKLRARRSLRRPRRRALIRFAARRHARLTE